MSFRKYTLLSDDDVKVINSDILDILIPCEACGHKISKFSKSCVNCGHPTEDTILNCIEKFADSYVLLEYLKQREQQEMQQEMQKKEHLQ